MDKVELSEEEALKILDSNLWRHMDVESTLVPALCMVVANMARRLKALEDAKRSPLSDLEKLSGKSK